jgi:hypothetical protein
MTSGDTAVQARDDCSRFHWSPENVCSLKYNQGYINSDVLRGQATYKKGYKCAVPKSQTSTG